MASAAQIAANRQNALRSTGPKTEEGKEASRRNALKHGLTGMGVVVPGELEHEVAIRADALKRELAPEGSVAALILIEQMAMASIRAKRAFRHETALAAERMRRAEQVYLEERLTGAAEIWAGVAADPAVVRRRLIAAPEGIDLLVGRLRGLLPKAETRTFVAWDVAEGAELDYCLGERPEADIKSRAGLLTRGIVYDHWVGLDPAEFAGLNHEERIDWALGQIQFIITTAIAALAAHRATLDLSAVEQGRAEAAERSLLDLGPEGTALRRYAGAAERMTLKLYSELRSLRRQFPQEVASPPPATEVVASPATQEPVQDQARSRSASFRRAPDGPVIWDGAGAACDAGSDPKTSFVPIKAGRDPDCAAPAGR